VYLSSPALSSDPHSLCSCSPLPSPGRACHLLLSPALIVYRLIAISAQEIIQAGFMKDLLTDQWGAWVAAAETRSCENLLPFKFVERDILPALQEQGFVVPSQRTLRKILEQDAGPLPSWQGCRETTGCSFAHLVNLVWRPVLNYMDSCTSTGAPDWTEALGKHHDALVAEMAGNVSGVEETMDMDTWIEDLKRTLFRLLKVDVPKRLILQVMSPVVPFHVAPTPANMLHLLRSGLCSQLVGPALAAQASRMILAEIAEVPVTLQSDADLALRVQQDLVDTLERQLCGPTEGDGDERALKKNRKTASADEENMITKTSQVLFMLRNRLPSTRVCQTISGASELMQGLHRSRSSSSSSSSLQGDDWNELFERVTLMRHLLLLDGAVDRFLCDRWLTLRELGKLAGVAVASDESPPSQPRFRGLRFQITILYIGTFLDLHQWNSSTEPPLVKSTCLADIMHCPGKKGVDVSRVIEKQLARQGLNCFDVCSGTGDGGGENEGAQGVHAFFENLNPGYVRRRCLPHISWRTCDVAIRASDLKYRALASYFVEGITWGRLRELATRSLPDGGLDLFRDGSRQCQEIFGKSPSAIVENRPETDLNFLKLLEGKEHLLHTMATKDLEQRSLSADTRAAILTLADIKARIHRRILQEILERCMYLYYWSGSHPSVACETSWEDLMQRAVSLILSLEMTPQVLERFHVSEDDVQAMDPRPRTWVDLAVLQVVGEQDLVAERLPESLEFHRRLSDQAAAHLNLLADNTFRTPWLAAKILSKDRHQAKEAAETLVRHLASTRPGNRTSFEEHLFTREELYSTLVEFSQAEPAVLVWQSDGKYACLFKFLAPRFLLAPDHVLDAERVHARWQWICRNKRGLRLQSLNAMLRLMQYMEANQSFPSHEALLLHLQAECLEHRLSLEALDADVPSGWRHL